MTKSEAISLAAQIGHRVSSINEFMALLKSKKLQFGLDNETGDWIVIDGSGEVIARQD